MTHATVATWVRPAEPFGQRLAGCLGRIVAWVMRMTHAALDRLGADFADLGEVLEARGRLQQTDLTRFRQDILGFVAFLWPHIILTPAQQAHLLAVQQNTRVAAYGANGCGKSFDDALVALWSIYAWDALVIAVSAKESQLTDQYMRDVRRLFITTDVLWGEVRVLGIRRLDNPDSGLLCMAAGSEHTVRSYHAARVVFQIHEAQGAQDFVYGSAEIMAIGNWDKITLTGNPTDPSGPFYKRCMSAHWHPVRFDAREHPNVVEGRVVIPGGPTRESIAQRARDFGETSPLYISSVLGEFPFDTLDALVTRAMLDRAADRYESGALESRATGDWVAALDVARFGPDKTVLSARQGPVLRQLIPWSGRDTMQTCGLVLEQLRSWGAPLYAKGRAPVFGRLTSRLITDEVGLGAGVLDRLKEQEFPVGGFNGAASAGTPAERARFLNQRASAFFHLRALLEADRIALPRHEQLFEELTVTRWKVSSSGLVQIEAKEDLSSRLGRSPDFADSVCMCFSTFERRTGVPWSAADFPAVKCI